jgi:hypothetical protein
MATTEITEYWWLLPLLVMFFCCVWKGGCCCGSGRHYRDVDQRKDQLREKMKG